MESSLLFISHWKETSWRRISLAPLLSPNMVTSSLVEIFKSLDSKVVDSFLVAIILLTRPSTVHLLLFFWQPIHAVDLQFVLSIWQCVLAFKQHSHRFQRCQKSRWTNGRQTHSLSMINTWEETTSFACLRTVHFLLSLFFRSWKACCKCATCQGPQGVTDLNDKACMRSSTSSQLLEKVQYV